ncbi:M20 family metallopeptidase [Lewinella sp. LCG006]|uniref:M20 metallopeptidase family protein n=1 Tax=Lewinella sp. LCG006 TaxID=3231911 RepID=UPI00345F2F25
MKSLFFFLLISTIAIMQNSPSLVTEKPSDLAEFVKTTAASQHLQAIQIWKDLNAIAEPSWHEDKTAVYTENFAKHLGVPVIQLPGSHTRIMRIEGTGKGPNRGVLAYKVDLDALPYKQSDGSIMYKHSCFHSGHMAIALSIMETLWKVRAQINATVLFIFQTAEETPNCGARELLASTLWNDLKIDRIVALHASPELAYDQVAVREGYAQAGIDILTFNVAVDTNKIKSSHVAKPHAGANTIWAAIKLATQMKLALAETSDPVHPLLFNIVQFGSSNFGMDNVNITPEQTTFIVNLRVFDMDFKKEVMKKVEQMIAAIELEYGGLVKIEIKSEPGPDPVFNNPELAKRTFTYAQEVLGNDKVSVASLRSGSDDLGVYSQILPVVMVRLGTGNPAKGIVTDLHNERFTVDTDCFITGITTMSYVILKELGVSGSF